MLTAYALGHNSDGSTSYRIGDALAFREVRLNARQRGVLLTGHSDSSGRGLVLGGMVTRKALLRRGLVDQNFCWTERGRAVVRLLGGTS